MVRFIISIFLIVSGSLHAQQKIKPFWGDSNRYLMEQTRQSFVIIDEMLAKYPPKAELNSIERQAALQLFDQVVHDTRLDGSAIFGELAIDRIGKVMEDFNNPIPQDELRVYKLYNAGIIARTADVTVAFDMIRGSKVMATNQNIIPDSLMRLLVDRCEIMFLSHNHPDHIDRGVVDMFIAAGKPVIAPAEALEGVKGVTHIEAGKIIQDVFEASNGKKLKLMMIPGHQDEMQNNINVVTFPNGNNIAHTGDQYSEKDVPMIQDIHKRIGHLDVLVMNCWINAFDETIAGFDPELLISTHENEQVHSIDHREAYWFSHQKLLDVHRPTVLMTWGEYYPYTKTKK